MSAEPDNSDPTVDISADYPSMDALTLDANAAAGMLMEIFGTEMTIAESQCTYCGNRGEIGTLRAYMHAPGVVLRCSVCTQVVIRVMRRGDGGFLVDARGAAYIRM